MLIVVIDYPSMRGLSIFVLVRPCDIAKNLTFVYMSFCQTIPVSVYDDPIPFYPLPNPNFEPSQHHGF